MKLPLLLTAALLCSLALADGKTEVYQTLSAKALAKKKNEDCSFVHFWATWCKPCKQELENIQEVYDDWREETNVKLIAISIDDARNTSKIKPLVNAKGWEYEVYQDSNREFATKMGVNPIPHTFLLNGDKKIVWDHVTYSDGDEEELYEKILEILE